ncbi:junctophilin-1-like isoform X2 [Babylonia areolata]|uniref:junctophilin-1-like isoform X2 n=1 Tax=Babylonia areolata TaxID=304850 RepID=UPI003FD1570B
MTTGGGRFDFDDGGTYCGGWEDGKAHGHGVCTGPKGQGEYAGAWQYGFEVSGVYTWPSGNAYKGQWFQGKRHGLGLETKGRWMYRGEWTQGFKGRYGVRQSTTSGARYEGTWTTGLQDGYGCESYADGGTYQGQWYRGTRHGYGVRQSVPYGLASHYRPKALRASLTSLRSENEDEMVQKNRDKKLDESRGGFVLKARSDETPPQRRRSIFDKQGRSSLRKTLMSGLKLKKQKSTGDINDSPKRQTGSVRSTISNISHVSADSTQSGMTNASMYTDSNLSFVSQDDITDVNVTETYMGEWKNDKRSGFGISERSDGLKYEGEWYNNRKYGYGVTTFKDGTKEEGKYKNNVIISSGKKNKLFLIRTSKLRERVDNAVLSAQRAAQIALQKADIAITRMANARAKAEQADLAAEKAQQDSDVARLKAKEYAPEFHQPGTDILKKKMAENEMDYDFSQVTGLTANHAPHRSKSLQNPQHHQDPSAFNSPFTAMSAHPSEGSPPGRPNDYSYMNAGDGMGAGGGGGLSPHGGGGGGLIPGSQLQHHQQQQAVMNMTPSSHNRSPSLKVRRYSFLAGSRHGRTFSDIFNSTILTDHFDQYSAGDRDDSGLGRDVLDDPAAGNHLTARSSLHPLQQQLRPGKDTSPDSGLSDDDSKLRPLQRRRTMPCIVDNPTEGDAGGGGLVLAAAAAAARAHRAVKEQPTAHSSEDLMARAINPETYIIENGIRKRVKAEVHQQAQRAPGQLPRHFRIEENAERRETREARVRGSLPDLKHVTNVKPISRVEAYRLSNERREEIRRLQDLAERRRHGDVGVILGDVKDWCQERQLLVLVIAVNLSLATMFFHLLS